MFEMLLEMFSYSFMTRALLVGCLVSLCAALLGVTLVLKRDSMIGDGLSHVGFGALAIAAACGLAPLQVAVPVVIVAAFFLLKLNENSRIHGDAAIALVSTSALAAGVVTVSVTTGLNTDLYNYMFGSILVMTDSDVWLSVILSVAVLVLFVLFRNRMFAVTFDEPFARANGTDTGFYHMLIAVLTAVTVVLGMRMMGSLLISGLIIFPALTAMRLCRQFRTVLITAACVSVSCFAVGLVLSYLLDTPTGATIVLADLTVFLIACLFDKIRRT